MHSIPAEPAPSPERSKDLLFVGNRYDPNIQGMQLFLEECWPDILNQIPDAQLHVCGTICRDIATCSTTRNITLHDVVPDLTPFYRQAAVIINPVCYGTGLPIKTLEAMSFGKCVVGMAAAVRGFPKEPSPPVSVARTISGMTDQITPLLTKPELRHEQETQVTKYINEHMSPSEVYGALLSRLQQHNTNQKHGQTITASSLMSRIKNYYFRTAIRHELRRLCNRYFSPIHPAQTLSPAFVKAHVRQVWRLLNVDHAYQRVALFGAGDHTQWLQHCVQHDDGPTVTAIIDDKPSDRQLFDLPVTRSDSFSPETCDAIVLSSDCWQAPMLQRCRELFGKEVPIVDLYDNLPPGPYRK
jgi:hypothetical protein